MQKLFSTVIASVIFFSATICFAQTKDEMAITTILQTQETNWNKGALESFMEGYWKNDSLMFIGKSGITYGWQKTLDNYKKGYPEYGSYGEVAFYTSSIETIIAGFLFCCGQMVFAKKHR